MHENKYLQFILMLINQNEHKPIEYYSRHIGVTNKTIYNYLDKSEYLLEKYKLKLEKKHSIGIKIIGEDSDISEFSYHILKNENGHSTRGEAILFDLLISNEKTTIRKLSEKYFVSTSSIINDLNNIENYLKKYNLSLQRNRDGTKIVGDEISMRDAQVTTIINDIYIKKIHLYDVDSDGMRNYLKKYFDEMVIYLSLRYIEIIENELFLELEKLQKVNLLINIIIFLKRILSKNQIIVVNKEKLFRELNKIQVYPITFEIKNDLEKKHNITINQNEVDWLNTRISSIYKERNLKVYGDVSAEIEFSNDLITYVSDSLKVNLNEDVELKENLIAHLIPFFKRLSNNYQIQNPYINDLKNQYSALFGLLKLVLSLKGYDFISDDEISFLLIHFQLSLERNKASKYIVVFSNESLLIAKLIQTRIRNIVSPYDVVDVCNQYDELIEINNKKNIDILVTTSQVSLMSENNCVVSPIMEENDEQKFKEIYDNLDRYNVSGKYAYLSNLISEESFMNLEDCTSKEEILKKGSDLLYKSEKVTANFYESVLKRENINSTYLGNGVAIPHGDGEHVHKNQILIITTDNKLNLWPERVEIIFLLALSTDNYEEMRKILGVLYELLNDKEILNALKSCKQFECFSTVLNSNNKTVL